MSLNTSTLREKVDEFAATLPNLDPSQQRWVLAAYRLLAEGQPFGPEELAEPRPRP